MAKKLTEQQRLRVDEFRARHKTGVLTLVFTDMVDSTAIKRDLGDASGTHLIEHQQDVIREMLAAFGDEGNEIMTAGDSFLITFTRPSDAVRFSLQVQSRLRQDSKFTARPIAVRIGIHMGEVFIDRTREEKGRQDVLGIQVDSASRVMDLGVGGQILMTRSVFDNARAVLRGVEIPELAALSWLNHGFYSAKGVEEPFELCEVGEEGVAPLTPPANSHKAQRFIIPDFEPVIGWHPGLDVEVPTAAGWVLQEKIGEGGFGEVWRAYNKSLREHRVFKFCFRADRVRSLKREVTLFRLLREQIGDHPNIVRINDVYFDEAPYYIVMDHFDAIDLNKWWASYENPVDIPMDTRINIVIQVANALEVAHNAGIIHRDIKPSNILIASDDRSVTNLRVKLTDFGIGQVLPENLPLGITADGLTEVLGRTELSSRTGTRVYMAPEVLVGRDSSAQSDIYSLGVVLYQLVLGDLFHPVTTDWRDRVEDEVIAEDIGKCFAGEPNRRFSHAAELADRLSTIDSRREARKHQIEQQIAADDDARKQSDKEKLVSRHTDYCSTITLAAECVRELRFSEARALLAECPSSERNWEWGRLQYVCNMDRLNLGSHDGGASSSLCFSPDGARLASGGNDGCVRLWDLEAGDLIVELEGHGSRVDALAWEEEGRILASGSADGLVLIWDTENEILTNRLEGHTNLIESLSFHPNGDHLLSDSWDKTVRVWDIHRAREIALWEGRSSVNASYNSSGEGLMLECWDRQAHLWDLDSHQKKTTLQGNFPKLGIYSSAFSTDNDLVATGDQDGTARVWDTLTGEEIALLKGHLGGVPTLSFAHQSRLLLTGSSDRTARIWNVDTEKEIQCLKGHSETVSCVGFSRDGSQIATGSFDQDVKVWDRQTARDHRELAGHTSNVWSVSFSPDGNLLATSSGESVWGETPDVRLDNSARIWEVSSGKEIQRIEGHESNVWCARFSLDGTLLATGSADRTLCIWDVETGRLFRKLEGHEGFVLAVAFSPDGQTLASGGRDSTIRLWDIKKGVQTLVLKRHSGPVGALSYHPDGLLLASGSWDGSARLWDVKAGQEITTLPGHSDSVDAVAWSPDGHLLATGGKDNSIRLWDPDQATQLSLLTGSKASVSSLAFSQDGKRLLSGRGDNSATIWDLESGKELLSLEGHKWFVVDAVFSPDGTMVATASSDTTAILWPTFPWREEDLPGDSVTPLKDRIESYKRQLRKPKQTQTEVHPVRATSV